MPIPAGFDPHVSPYATTFPAVIDLDAYLQSVDSGHSWTDEEMRAALDAEAANQYRVCVIPDPFEADLREALLRRAARALAIKRQLAELPRGEGDFNLPPLVSPGRDPEVRRLEWPWRRVSIG